MWSKLTTELTTILTTISKKETKRDKKQNAEKALFYKEKQHLTREDKGVSISIITLGVFREEAPTPSNLAGFSEMRSPFLMPILVV